MKKLALLKILINENDTLHGKNLAEFILQKARDEGLSGATVWRGIGGYGVHREIHLGKFPEFSMHLPVVVEIIDIRKKIKKFGDRIEALLNQNNINGLVVMYEVLAWGAKTNLKSR